MIFESVTAQFRRQLADLMGRIGATQPHFVRCINPNARKAPGQLEPEMVLDQLRCSGLMEAVRVSRAGFPVRILHADFLDRFALLSPRPPGDARAAVGQMAAALRVSPGDCRLGTTKVFMRREAHERLEEDRSRLLVRQIIAVQRTVRGHWARVTVRALRVARRRAAVAIESMARRALVQRWYRGMLERRRAALEKSRAAPPPPPVGAAAGPGPVPSPAINGMPKNLPDHPLPPLPLPAVGTSSAVRPPPPPMQAARLPARAPPPEQATGMATNDGLEAQLGSVRALYYDERDGLQALSGLVKEVCSMGDEALIAGRIAIFEAALLRHQPGAPDVKASAPTADPALLRRADSLRAGVALLKDKWALIRTVKQAQAQAAQAHALAAQAAAQAKAARAGENQQAQAAKAAATQAHAAQEQAGQALMQARSAQAQAHTHAQQLAMLQAQSQARQQNITAEYAAREQQFRDNELALKQQIATIQKRLDNARRELNGKDDAIILLNGEVQQHQLVLIQRQEGRGAAVEADMKEMRARVQDLQSQNEELRAGLELAQEQTANLGEVPGPEDLASLRKLEARAAQFEESVVRERKGRDTEFEAMDANIRARDEQIRDLTDRCQQLEEALAAKGANEGVLTAYLADSTRINQIAQQVDVLLSSLDATDLPKGVAKYLQARMIELSKEEKDLASIEGSEQGSLEMVSALGRLLEAYCAFLSRLLGSDVFLSSAGSVLM
jgi:myosin heavy subunit